jgi:hypothetical protein
VRADRVEPCLDVVEIDPRRGDERSAHAINETMEMQGVEIRISWTRGEVDIVSSAVALVLGACALDGTDRVEDPRGPQIIPQGYQ